MNFSIGNGSSSSSSNQIPPFDSSDSSLNSADNSDNQTANTTTQNPPATANLPLPGGNPSATVTVLNNGDDTTITADPNANESLNVTKKSANKTKSCWEKTKNFLLENAKGVTAGVGGVTGLTGTTTAVAGVAAGASVALVAASAGVSLVGLVLLTGAAVAWAVQGDIEIEECIKGHIKDLKDDEIKPDDFFKNHPKESKPRQLEFKHPKLIEMHGHLAQEKLINKLTKHLKNPQKSTDNDYEHIFKNLSAAIKDKIAQDLKNSNTITGDLKATDLKKYPINLLTAIKDEQHKFAEKSFNALRDDVKAMPEEKIAEALFEKHEEE
jgi:hypothetical protein